MTGIEATVYRVATQAGQKLFTNFIFRYKSRQTREGVHPLMSRQVAERFLREISEAEARQLDDYIHSPDFEEIALQLTLGSIYKDVPADTLQVNIRDEIRQGVNKNVRLRRDLRYECTNILYYALLASVDENTRALAGTATTSTIATTAQAAAIAAANSNLLSRVHDLAKIHEFSQTLRKLVKELHGFMRTPHLGASTRPILYRQLYVEPNLVPLESEAALVPKSMVLPGRRTVILGDPGAGKSTFAAKLAHDIAGDLIPGCKDKVPFLLVLRNFSASMREGDKPLLHYLEQVCRNPYNLEPPAHAVEYLLRNGRAIVVLDGIDELVDPELRRRVVELVHGFANQYPLVPMLVTARRIGYHEAPLPTPKFALGVMVNFNDRQVRQYSENWFTIDVNTAENETRRLAASFMAESKSISELRSNPLLLTLLCAMYSAEHYIPRNLAQIYEKCALMLFERWDSMRGIVMPLQFQGQLRGAVQYLAWRLSSSEEPDKGLPGPTVIRYLADYLVNKKFDEDEAVATASQFLEFCTGRAWILTDVGATESAARYGFAHRTFLEYFAAEHLVRTHPAAEQLWDALQPRIIAGGWDVAGQIALQLLDRNVDGGVDELLRLATAAPTPSAAGAEHRTLRLHTFAARTLGFVCPSRDVVDTVVASAVRDALSIGSVHPFSYWVTNQRIESIRMTNGPFRALKEDCLPANRPVVVRSIAQTVTDLVKTEDPLACFAVESLARAAQQPGATRSVPRELLAACQEILKREYHVFHEARLNGPWADVCSDTDPVDLVTRFGPSALYLNCAIQLNTTESVASRIVGGSLYSSGPHVDNAQLCDALVGARTPWIDDDRWWTDFPAASELVRLVNPTVVRPGQGPRMPAGPMLLLMVPYLEARTHSHFNNLLLSGVPDVVYELDTARMNGAAGPNLERLLRICTLTDQVRTFLLSWARGEFSVVGPPPAHLR